ncbi:hypothetical protein C8Q75DRAFT_368873 [Abortiporus biennis]|nr:hypothetical protein C8Q75DRAFT_368873 [Abortiporus biennis]
MATIGTPLYRAGNTTSPRFDNLRPQDIPVVNGQVRPNTGGISTFSVRDSAWGANRTWVLQRGTLLGPDLQARNDRATHWSLEPSRAMPRDTYVAALTVLNGGAVRFDRIPQARDASAPGTFALELPIEFNHESEQVRNVYQGLASVARNKVPVEDWDENDYTHIAIIAQSLHSGETEFSELVYKSDELLIGEQALVAGAILAHIGHKDAEYKEGGDSEEKAKWAEQRESLVSALKLQELKEHPVLEKACRVL